MKETKVYVDELPEICDECPCHSVMEDRCVLLRKQAIEPFLQSCPLKSLKTHDQELVEKVCEKIKKKARWLWYFVYAEQKDYFKGNRYVLSEKDLNEILDHIQKEFEK